MPHGAVTRHIYHSDVLNGERELYVYTPPGYSPKKNYPVLYLVGGSGELASGWSLDGLLMGGRHTQLIGLKNLDLFSSFGVLSAGDPDTEKVSAAFLNDPAANQKVDYLLVGQGTHEADAAIGKRVIALHEALQKHTTKHDYYVGGDGAQDWGTCCTINCYLTSGGSEGRWCKAHASMASGRFIKLLNSSAQ